MVETQLEYDILKPGEEFRAQVVIKGGEVEQDISG
ncbi:sporulation protein [Spartinivicinus ruber]